MLQKFRRAVSRIIAKLRSLRRRLSLSRYQKVRLSRLLKLLLVVTFFIGLERQVPALIVNAGFGLIVTQTLPILKRDMGITMNPGLQLWITAAAALPAFSIMPLPWDDTILAEFCWWSMVTGTLNASLIPGLGYTSVRICDLHVPGVAIPNRYSFVFIFIFTVGWGVAWVGAVTGIGEVALLLGADPENVRFSLNDQILTLTFTLIDATGVAWGGRAYLSH